MNQTKCDIVIKNCLLLTEEFEIEENMSIAIKDSHIVAVDKKEVIEQDYISSETINGKHKIFMPGLIDAHTHICQQLLRGKIMDQLPMIWKRIMVPFESNLTPEDVRISAQLANLEMIKSGTTSFSDAGGMYMDEVASVVIASGLRGAITPSTMDNDSSVPKNMLSTIKEIINRNTDLYNTYHGAGDGRLSIWFSLRTLISCSEDLVLKIFEMADEYQTNVHVHMNEYPNEINYSLEHHQKRPIEYLDSLGVLGPNLVSAHSILLSENEIDLIQKNDVKVVHCPISNLGKGMPKTPRLLQSNIKVGLGTDGTAHAGLSLFNEMKVFRSAMHIGYGVPTYDPLIMPAKTLLNLAIKGGAQTTFNEDKLGSITAGKKADLISIDLNQPHIYPSHNLVNTLVEAVNHTDVKDMIVDGKIIMRNREVLTLDEEKIIYEGREALKKLTIKAGI